MFIRRGIIAHTHAPEQFPASAIVAFMRNVRASDQDRILNELWLTLAQNLLRLKAVSTESAEELSHVRNGPNAVQTIVHHLLDTYLTLWETFKHTLAAAKDEG